MEQELSIFKKELNEELTNILSFWMKNTVDDKNGGFFGQIDHNNQIIEQAPKGAVLNSRIVWTFSAAFNATGQPEYLEMATRAYDYNNQYFYDDLEGGLIWEVDYRGEPVNTRKQTYAQGFGIYGYSEFYKASGKEESLDRAKALYNSIETHCLDAQFGGYIEAFAKDWHPLEDMRLSPKDENYPKSMNTHLHFLNHIPTCIGCGRIPNYGSK